MQAIHQPDFAAPVEEASETSPLQAVVKRARVLLHRRALWLAHLTQREKQAGADGAVRGELRRALLDLDAPEEEARYLSSDSAAQALSARAEQLQMIALNAPDSPFRRLAGAFGLNGYELDLLQFCAAVQVDSSLGLLLEHVTDANARRFVTEPLVARVYGHGRRALRTPMGPLQRWQLISEEAGYAGEPPPLRLDPFVQAFVAGARELDAALWAFAHVVLPREPLPAWPVQETRVQVEHSLARGHAVRLVVRGPESSGRRTFAACVAQRFGAALFAVDVDRVDEASLQNVVLHARRQALLHGSAIVWLGSTLERAFSREHSLLPLEFVVLDAVQELAPAHDACVQLRVDLLRLTARERLELWQRLLPPTLQVSAAELTRIAQRFSVQVGDIAHIASQDLRSEGAIETTLRGLHRGKLGALATLVACPFRRSDLELNEGLSQRLDELLFEAKERSSFWDDPKARRLFPRGTGLIALLAGPPGTGKTMAAQVVAAELGLDLFRIDLASMVSKYIGETSKNLRQLFARASEMDAVLLFDEADALFSKRTDVRDALDRHANADVNYLLQLLEAYPGVALLATNRRQSIDEAFIRRIRYLLQFERPEAKQRRAIWRQVLEQLSSESSVQTMAEELEQVARSVEVTGAQIKNAALAAAFFARQSQSPLCMEHVYRGLERELGNHGRELPLRPARKGGSR